MNGAPKKSARAEYEIQSLRQQLDVLGYELDTYREETEVQTHQLIQIQAELEGSHDQYVDLFDFAPAAYLILDGWGVITKANLTASTVLKQERARLIGAPLRSYIAASDRMLLLDHMRRCRATDGRIETELRLCVGKGDRLLVQLLSRRSLEAPEGAFLYPTMVSDLTERERAESARNMLLRRLMTAQEIERQRMSRDLHDQLGQQTTALVLGLRGLEAALAGSPHAEHARRLALIAEELGRDAHRVALDLRPMALDDLGLREALASYVDEWSRRTGIPVTRDFTAALNQRLSAEVETVLFRAVQEALTNVAKHAHASRASVILQSNTRQATAIIEDDGRGFDADLAFEAAIKAGRLGLVGLRERVQLIGGKLDIESADGRGTTVFVRVPMSFTPYKE
jgi:PAS domain S-box-containing protein